MTDKDLIDIRNIVPRKGVVARVSGSSVFATRKDNGDLAFFIDNQAVPGEAVKVLCRSVEGEPGQGDSVETTVLVGQKFPFRFVPLNEMSNAVTEVKATYDGIRPTPVTDANVHYTPETMFLDDFEDELEPADDTEVEAAVSDVETVAQWRPRARASRQTWSLGKVLSSLQSALSALRFPGSKRGVATMLVGPIIGSGLVLLAIPSIDVTVDVHTHQAILNSQLVISPTTPGFQVRTVTQHDTSSLKFQTSGTKLTPGTNATVEMVFTNNCGPNVGSLKLVPGQKVETAQGVEYTQPVASGAVVVNPDGVPVPVLYAASNPGNNVGAGSLTAIEGLQASEKGCFTATNPVASRGGVVPVLKPAMSDADLVRAQGEVKTALASQEAAALANAKRPGETLVVEPFSKLDSFSTDQLPGAFTDGFVAQGSSTEVGVYYVNSQVNQAMVNQFLRKEVAASWKVTGGAPKVTYKLTGEDASGKLTFDFTATASIAFNRDAGSLNSQLRWRDDKSVRDYLKSLGVDSVVIHRSWYQIPWRFNVVVHESKSVT